MKSKKVLGWHWTNGMKLRDGQRLVVGKTYRFKGELVMCARGYHASKEIRDALSYAPGFTVSRVECSGDIGKHSDKMVCRNRKVLWTVDAKKIVLAWSIRCATDAVKRVRETSTDKAWNAWADLWISGKDRTYATANAAYAASAAALASAYAAALASAYAANAANAANAYAASNASYAASSAALASAYAANSANASAALANAASAASAAAFASAYAANAANAANAYAASNAYAAAVKAKYSKWLVDAVKRDHAKEFK